MLCACVHECVFVYTCVGVLCSSTRLYDVESLCFDNRLCCLAQWDVYVHLYHCIGMHRLCAPLPPTIFIIGVHACVYVRPTCAAHGAVITVIIPRLDAITLSAPRRSPRFHYRRTDAFNTTHTTVSTPPYDKSAPKLSFVLPFFP